MKYFENEARKNCDYLAFTRGYFDCDYTYKKGDLLLEFQKSKDLKFLRS